MWESPGQESITPVLAGWYIAVRTSPRIGLRMCGLSVFVPFADKGQWKLPLALMYSRSFWLSIKRSGGCRRQGRTQLKLPVVGGNGLVLAEATILAPNGSGREGLACD